MARILWLHGPRPIRIDRKEIQNEPDLVEWLVYNGDVEDKDAFLAAVVCVLDAI